MRLLAAICSLLAFFRLADIEAQDLRLAFQKNDPQSFSLSVLNRDPSKGHTFIEFSTNGVWCPAYFVSSNSNTEVFTVMNAGGSRLFRAVQGVTAQDVKASWQRLGVTNYLFQYYQVCMCGSVVSAKVTVREDEVVKVEDARNVFGEPVENPPLSDAPTINQMFDFWLLSEPEGGYPSKLEFDLNGFPLTIDIDVDPRAIDEEKTYWISNFTPLP